MGRSSFSRIERLKIFVVTKLFYRRNEMSTRIPTGFGGISVNIQNEIYKKMKMGLVLLAVVTNYENTVFRTV